MGIKNTQPNKKKIDLQPGYNKADPFPFPLIPTSKSKDRDCARFLFCSNTRHIVLLAPGHAARR
jgi:hypothetical protein